MNPAPAWGWRSSGGWPGSWAAGTGVECTVDGGYRYWFDVELEKQEELESAMAPRLSKAKSRPRRALIVDAVGPVGAADPAEPAGGRGLPHFGGR